MVSFEGQFQVDEKMPTDIRSLTLFKDAESLLNITDSYQDFPATEILNILLDSIKHADGVSQAFFDLPASPAVWGGTDYTNFRNELAVELTCVSISKIPVYNFGNAVNGQKADAMWRNTIINRGTEAGRSLLLHHLVKHHDFQQYLDHKQEWCSKMEAIFSNEVYINGTIAKELAAEVDLPVKMKLFVLCVLGSTKFHNVIDLWMKHCDKPLVQKALDFVSKDNNLAFSVTMLQTDPFGNGVRSACMKSRTTSRETPVYNSYINPSVCTSTTYGGNVASWINSENGPKQLQLNTTGNNLKNTNSSCITPFPGCFLHDTEILTANGVGRRIEDLEENNIIVGAHGIHGTKSSEKVELTLENESSIYGLNGEACFFLECHPFWTQHGWCALNPDLAKKENPWLEVGQLTEGDFVRRIKQCSHDPKGHITYEWEEVQSIHNILVPGGTKVYGIHTREGLRSYHANGYLVMQNYPEITKDRVKQGMEKLSIKQQIEMHQRLDELSPLLEEILGPGASKSIGTIAQTYKLNDLSDSGKGNKKQNITQLVLPTYHLHKNAGCITFNSYSMPVTLNLIRGHLYLDGVHISDVNISNNKRVSWYRSVEGLWEHGVVELYENKLQGHAFISLTESKQVTQAIISAQFRIVANVNMYKCYRSEKPIHKNDEIADSWIHLGDAEMGAVLEDGEVKEVGKVSILPNLEKLSNLHHHVLFSVDSKSQLRITVSIPVALQSVIGYTKLQGIFNWDYSSFSGQCTKYDRSKPDLKGDTFQWRGTIEHKTDDLLMHSREMAFHHQRHDRYETVGGTYDTEMSAMVRRLKEISDQHLSLEKLYTLTPPDPQSLHDLNFRLIQEAMKYEMPDDLRENILGVVKPDLDGEMIDIANNHSEFLVDKFLNGYLMNGFSQNLHFKDKMTQDQRNQLLYYWAGSGKTSISKDPAYTKVNDEVSRVAFLRSCPELRPYVSSESAATDWGKQLYNKLLEPQILNGLALAADVTATMKIIQKQAMVLHILSPKEDYCKDFYKKIMMTRLNITSSFFKGGKEKEDVMKEFVKDYIFQLILQILSGEGTITGELNKELTKQLMESAKELKVSVKTSAEVIAHDMMSHMSSIIDDFIALFTSASGTMWEKIATGMSDWMKKFPRLTKLGRFLSSGFMLAFWGLSFYTVATDFMRWDKLTDVQRTQLVLNTVALTTKVFSKIPDLLKNKKGWFKCCEKGEMDIETAENIVDVQNDPDVVPGQETNLQSIEATMSDPEPLEIAMSKASATAAEEGVSLLTKVFAVSEEFANVLGVIAMAGGCVAMGFQVADDFKTGAPVAQKVLDILQLTSFAIGTAVAAVGLFVTSACIPIIGTACALIGILLMFVGLFIHRDPPKSKPTEADSYFNGKGISFVKTLDKPEQTWLGEYHKRHPKKKEV